MSLHSTLLADLTAAMKARDTETTATLRMLKSALLLVAKESGASDMEELSDDQVIVVLQKEAKKRKESIAAFRDGGREDLVATEEAELAIIDKYLPEQMGEDEIEAAVRAVMEETGASDFGSLMGPVMGRLKGQADGNVVRSVVEKVLKE